VEGGEGGEPHLPPHSAFSEKRTKVFYFILEGDEKKREDIVAQILPIEFDYPSIH
jgi:hypothetical protein